MKWIIKIWQQLPLNVKEILKWLFDTHLGESIKILSALIFLLWVMRKRISDFINRVRAAGNLPNHSGFTSQDIKQGIKYYIWPECQSVDPAQSDEVRSTIAVRSDLREPMDQMLGRKTIYKHFIILADTGMGKTSFLLNYQARYLRRWHKPLAMESIPLGASGLKERLKSINSPEKTLLLLDSFDEDTRAIENHTQRLHDIMAWTRDFHRVIITCRTQFFPRDEEIPKETGIIKVGPRGVGEGPQFTFYKLYLSPFSDEQIQAYLKRRFPIWRKKKRQQAKAIVEKIPNLAVRPMLLTYVDYLIDSGKSFENCYQIYAEMVEAWLKRESEKEDERKALYEFSNKLAVNLFLNFKIRGGERIPYDEIDPLAKEFGITLATWRLTGRSLLNRDAQGNYKFTHRSILEFLFAQQLLADNKDALKFPMKYWTEQIKTFVFEGTGGRTWKIPLFFIAFKGGAYKLKGTEKAIEIKPFEMCVYPVTNREYEEYDPSHKRDKYSDQKDQPVVNVSWEEAIKYCKWLSEKTGDNFRLPTEAEWEVAAGGGGQRAYPWGNEKPTPKHANYYKSKIGETTPVGDYPLGRTPEGLYDMAGNVWEWCVAWYKEENSDRVLRGGAFGYGPDLLRCADRVGRDPQGRKDAFGFRVVRVP